MAACFWIIIVDQGEDKRKNWLPVPTGTYCEFVVVAAVKIVPKFVQTAKSDEAWSW
jgi:hypothetical protein